MSYAILRFEKVKALSELGNRMRHNSRVVVPENADKARLGLNRHMGNALRGFKAAAAGVKMRKNGVLAVEAVMAFSPGAKVDLEEWQKASLAWIEKAAGKGNVLQVDLHLDEESPHLHVIFLPRDEKGKWNCRELLGGKKRLVALQSSYAEAVKGLGLERGKESGRAYIEPQVYRELVKPFQEEVAKLREEVAKMASFQEEMVRILQGMKLDWEGIFQRALDASKDRKKRAREEKVVKRSVVEEFLEGV